MLLLPLSFHIYFFFFFNDTTTTETYTTRHTLSLHDALPISTMVGQRLAGGIGVTPILRAGLGLAEAFREVIPDIQVWHLGLRRDERTLQAMEYYNQLPHKVDLQVAYAIDPMLATGGSAIDAINILKLRN